MNYSLFTTYWEQNKKNRDQDHFLRICKLISNPLNQIETLQKQNFSLSNSVTEQDIANLCLGVKSCFSFYPRDIQLLSVLELYDHENDKGRLAQIYTGEGKTLIVAMLAVLLCKKRKSNVDIITSSSVLAIRDSKEYTKFYQYYNLTVSHNINNDATMKTGPLPCYECQIVYGDAHSFQGDILRHEYSEQGTRGNRKQEYAIVDEVDSMLIDGNSNKTQLSSTFTGMLDLNEVLQFIWNQLVLAQPLLSKDKKVQIILPDQAPATIELKEYIEKGLEQQLDSGLKNLFSESRLDYIKKMKGKWIKNAINALEDIKHDESYIHDGDQIRIVDSSNTGVISSAQTKWGDGLHQFLQLKHNLAMDPMSITTNFISNVSFFLRYKNKLLGLTGTLGSAQCQSLLCRQYRLDLIFLPPYKKRDLKEEGSVLVFKEKDWITQIKKSVRQQIQNGRAVLIINQCIEDAKKLANLLKNENQHLVLYTDDRQQISDEIESKGLIIATNLAGRGADFKPNEEVESNGGLHVILTFLPSNKRVEEQGFGRTCRQGRKGSAQLIVYLEIDNSTNYNMIEALKEIRNDHDKQSMEQIEQMMKDLQYEDECFVKFCYIAKSLANMHTESSKFKMLEEKWGIYLQTNEKYDLNEIENVIKSTKNENNLYLIDQAIESNNLDQLAEIAKKEPQSAAAQYYAGVVQAANNNTPDAVVKLKNAVRQLQFQKQIKISGKILTDQVNNSLNQQRQETAAFQGIKEFSQLDEILRKPIEDSKVKIIDFDKILGNQNQQGNINIGSTTENQNQQNDCHKNTQPQPEPQNSNTTPQSNETHEQKNDSMNYQRKTDSDRTHQYKKGSTNYQKQIEIEILDKIIKHIEDLINEFEKSKQNENFELIWKDREILCHNKDTLPVTKQVRENLQMNKTVKPKKTTDYSNWNYAALFAIGVCEVFLAIYFSPISAVGLYVGIVHGSSNCYAAIKNGILQKEIQWQDALAMNVFDMVSDIISLPLKIIDLAVSSYNFVKSFKFETIYNFLLNMKPVSVQQIQKSTRLLPAIEKVQFSKINQLFSQISEYRIQELKTKEYQLVKTIIHQYTELSYISIIQGEQIKEIIINSLADCKVDVYWKQVCLEMSQKYLFLKAQQNNQDARNNNEGKNNQAVEIFIDQQLTQMLQEQELFSCFDKKFKTKLQFFEQILIKQCLMHDTKICNQIMALDLFLKNSKQKLTYYQLQQRISENSNKQEFVQACQNLQFDQKESIEMFYNNSLRPILLNTVNIFESQRIFTGPLEVVYDAQLPIEYKNIQNQIDQNDLELRKRASQLQENLEQLKKNYDQGEANRLKQVADDFNSEVKQHLEFYSNYQKACDKENMNRFKKEIVKWMGLKTSTQIGFKFTINLSKDFEDYVNGLTQNLFLRQLFSQTMNKSLETVERDYQQCDKCFSQLFWDVVDDIVSELKQYCPEN